MRLGCSSIAHGELLVVGVEVVKSSVKDLGTGLSARQQPVQRNCSSVQYEKSLIFVCSTWTKTIMKFCHNLLILMMSYAGKTRFKLILIQIWDCLSQSYHITSE